MPKPKPDEVIRHEIVFGRSEKEMLEMVAGSYSANRILTPLVALISDASAMIILTPFLYSLFGPKLEMSEADPLLFAAITGPPTDYFKNVSLWYVMKRKTLIEDNKLTEEQLQAAEEIFLGNIPGFGTLFRAFR